MLNKTFLGIGALGAAALLLSGCGGSSFQKNTFANYPNTVSAAYGLEPVAASPVLNLPNNIQYLETSGLGTADSANAYLTAATAFSIDKNADGAGVSLNIDPNGKTVPLGFSTAGQYIDASVGTASAVKAVAPGASVVFRAALANGVSSGSTPAITTVTLTSADPQWTLGVLPLTFNDPGRAAGPLAIGTYVTGTNLTATPFALPFTTSGVHTLAVTVVDAAGRQTTTTFAIPVVAATDVALFLQNITPAAVAPATTGKSAAITPGDLVSLDGGTPAVADAQGTVILFAAPGTHTVTEKKPDNTAVQSATFTLPASAAGTTLFDAATDTGGGSGGGTVGGTGGGTATGALRAHSSVRR